MRKSLIKTTAVFFILAVAFAGCSQGGRSSSPAQNSGGSAGTASQKNSAFLTSVEAASMAYERAKSWNPDAVLWYMQAFQYRLHYNWVNTDESSGWLVAFGNPENESLLYVTIYNKEIEDVREMNSRYGPVEQSYSKNAPGIAMKQAVQAAISNGAPDNLMPYSVEYTMDGSENQMPGKFKPMWTFAYRFQITETEYDLHFYYVDGLTGEFIDMKVKNETGKIMDSSAARVKPADYSRYLSQVDNRHLILKYFTLIDECKYSDAIAMMDDNLVNGSASEKSWTDGWKALDEISIDWTYKYNEEQWTSDMQIFEVNLNVKPSAGSATNWFEGKNTRFVTVIRKDGIWLIHEIATGP